MVFDKEQKMFACIDAILEEEGDGTVDSVKTIQEINQ